jgi:hypothetical protein
MNIAEGETDMEPRKKAVFGLTICLVRVKLADNLACYIVRRPTFKRGDTFRRH